MGLIRCIIFSAIVSVTVGHTLFHTKPCLDSASEQPFKILKDIPWDIDCARQCKHESECMFMAYKSSEKECLLFTSNVSISESGCTDGDLQLYEKHEELVCEHGFKTPDDKCYCTDSYVGRRCDRIMEDCSEGHESGFYDGPSDKFWIKPRLSSAPFQVRCNMVHGKTVLQINSYENKPVESFDRTWQEYVDGFGNLNINHWLGLQKAFEITNSKDYNLVINVRSTKKLKIITYQNFKISDAASGFRLMIGPENSGVLYDCLSSLNNTRFSTPDQPTSSCAAAAKSGWWFDNSCSGCNVNENTANDRKERGAFWNAGFQNETLIFILMTLLNA